MRGRPGASAPAAGPLTAESIVAHGEAPCTLPGLLIVSHYQKDIGLVNTLTSPEPSEEPEDDGAEEREAFASMGLPIAFGRVDSLSQPQSKQQRRKGQQQQQQQQQDASHQGVLVDDASAAADQRQTSGCAWHQAYDGASGRYYYYNESLQVTQWEPPDGEAYEPCVGVWPGDEQTADVEGSSGAAAQGTAFGTADERSSHHPGSAFAAAAGMTNIPLAEEPLPIEHDKQRLDVGSAAAAGGGGGGGGGDSTSTATGLSVEDRAALEAAAAAAAFKASAAAAAAGPQGVSAGSNSGDALTEDVETAAATAAIAAAAAAVERVAAALPAGSISPGSAGSPGSPLGGIRGPGREPSIVDIILPRLGSLMTRSPGSASSSPPTKLRAAAAAAAAGGDADMSSSPDRALHHGGGGRGSGSFRGFGGGQSGGQSGVLLGGAGRSGERREGTGLLPAGSIPRIGEGRPLLAAGMGSNCSGGRGCDGSAGGATHIWWPASDEEGDDPHTPRETDAAAAAAAAASAAGRSLSAHVDAAPSGVTDGRRRQQRGHQATVDEPSDPQQQQQQEQRQLKRQKQQQQQRGSKQGRQALQGDPRERELQRHYGMDPAAAAHVRRLLPRSMAKYWLQRYSLFSRFDEGMQMDVQGWYSITPEAVARHQADRAACRVVVDAFAGCGGNAIAFAQTCDLVIAVEICPARLAMARHNATVYGVQHKIEFVCADFFAVAPTLAADCVFLSPPWGGPHYRFCDTFDLHTPLEGLGVTTAQLMEVSRAIVLRGTLGARGNAAAGGTAGANSQHQQQQSKQQKVQSIQKGPAARPEKPNRRRPLHRGVVAFLPRNTDLDQLSEFACSAGPVTHTAPPGMDRDLAARAVAAAAGVGVAHRRGRSRSPLASPRQSAGGGGGGGFRSPRAPSSTAGRSRSPSPLGQMGTVGCSGAAAAAAAAAASAALSGPMVRSSTPMSSPPVTPRVTPCHSPRSPMRVAGTSPTGAAMSPTQQERRPSGGHGSHGGVSGRRTPPVQSPPLSPRSAAVVGRGDGMSVTGDVAGDAAMTVECNVLNSRVKGITVYWLETDM